MKYIIISNRLPVTVTRDGAGFVLSKSSGGLATGLNSLDLRTKKHWLGWPGLCPEDTGERKTVDVLLRDQGFYPVHLDPAQIQDYYEGYCNSILWPLCHYFFSYIEYEERYWEAYREVNEIFCREALKIIEPGDYVWIHDYQLMLLPALIRARAPDVGIGYFHHIPFPSYELFRVLPERADILRGLLGADLIAFHTHDYMRHCLSALYRVLHLTCTLDEIWSGNRITRIDAFPMGINYALYHDGPSAPEAAACAQELRQLAGDCRIILSVDRLDYSKGIPFRLQSYDGFLTNNPEYKGKVTLIMVVVPSRDNVEMYAALKTRIDKMVGALNGAHAFVGWTPVHYFYRSFSGAELSAMYAAADIALVTPLRDGMNLVAKEYLAAKGDRPGVLILSEMAGAAIELSGAIIVNPMDTKQVENALLKALTMPKKDRRSAVRGMQRILSRRDVRHWAGGFHAALSEAKDRNQNIRARLLENRTRRMARKAYRAAGRRLLVLDYDGTLTPLVSKPALAAPRLPVRELLASLAADTRNKVVICSGRDKKTLEDWLGDLPLDLAAEHGAFFREEGKWQENMCPLPWNKKISHIFKMITGKTPGSRLERKKTALVWHYREVDPWLADLRVPQLVQALLSPCSELNLEILRGKMNVEVKQAGFNKGTEIRRLLEKGDYDFLLAMGDDATDEYMFAALPPEAITVKVGSFSDAARFWLPDQAQVHSFLTALQR
ncbi:MAG: bifunctional alpha,alpha-trehalose-phosphate synthase (UDP-forming)/trehalose-phosphatase [Desulfovibrio sp.]|jgi:trehalose 6-phosphate synthase/phosphatase|nr:bifunctional alpha,alpha-trehalose-phosphate synthase (UDP-forming)/trehalose-phosphatase [Desulfovibrio sp.]